jgi:hypothetical protein
MKKLEEQNQAVVKQMPERIYDSVYRFLASNPNFNPIDGTGL